MKRILIGLAGTAFIAGCSSGFDRPVQSVTAQTGSDGIQHVRIETHSFWFEPNRIVVTRGVPVELTIKNGAFFVPHDLTCEAKDAGIDVDSDVGMFGGSRKVRFTATKAGEYPFHCDKDGHAKKGMTGTLVVVEP
jgi:plastocyanin